VEESFSSVDDLGLVLLFQLAEDVQLVFKDSDFLDG